MYLMLEYTYVRCFGLSGHCGKPKLLVLYSSLMLIQA